MHGYQTYLYAEDWYSLGDYQKMTDCTQIYALELWSISQSILWAISLCFLLVIIIDPELYKLLLCFFYFLGPVYLTWTCVAVCFYSYFLDCCKDEDCSDFYPYQSIGGFIALLIVSLVFSGLLSVYLISIIVQALWEYFRTRYRGYADLVYN